MRLARLSVLALTFLLLALPAGAGAHSGGYYFSFEGGLPGGNADYTFQEAAWICMVVMNNKPGGPLHGGYHHAGAQLGYSWGSNWEQYTLGVRANDGALLKCKTQAVYRTSSAVYNTTLTHQ
jgi:hypothetical protein